MNHRARRIVEQLACERRYHLADLKGAEYSGAGSTYQETGADTLHNFKSVAERIGGTPEQVLMTYLLKHIDSINTAVREASLVDDFGQDVGARYAEGEGIVSRLDDARNYLDLLECLLIDNGHIDFDDAKLDPGAVDGTGETKIFTWQQDIYAAEQYIKDYSPVIGVKVKNENLQNALTEAEKANLKLHGLVEGLDGVFRGATRKDESVAPDALRETPICGPPPALTKDFPAQPTQDIIRKQEFLSGEPKYGETGELDG